MQVVPKSNEKSVLFLILSVYLAEVFSESCVVNRWIEIKKGIYISATETTIKEYYSYLLYIKSTGMLDLNNKIQIAEIEEKLAKDKNNSRLPVVNVTWYDCILFCEYLQKKDPEKKIKYRLPTDEEWSIAAGIDNEKGNTPWDKYEKRNRDACHYPWGLDKESFESEEDKIKKGLLFENFSRILHLEISEIKFVGSLRPNKLGIYDLGGNVSEWCSDNFVDSKEKIVRGPSVLTDLQSLGYESRLTLFPSDKSNDVGFRYVKEQIVNSPNQRNPPSHKQE